MKFSLLNLSNPALFAVVALGCHTLLFAETKLDFNESIRPILNQHCVACHGGVKQAGGLSFVYGDDASYVVEPGAPEDSELIDRVTSDDPELHMPPAEHGKPLSEEEVETLRIWITQGAQWGKHWAFVAPTRKTAPENQDKQWSRQTIDPFVLAKIEQAGLSPETEADPAQWLRRVSLDLIGLPPSLEERDEFLSALERDREAAYAAAVDRLLDSPHFGERWASVWLDVVRYADSKGLGIDGRRTIWKYRDWVIKAFNDDLPFSEFTIKQLAGDLLPEPSMEDLIATACHRLTQTCEEGGTDDEQFRTEAVIDRVNTTMLAWQGLTFGCVQCHAHPYDPIEHDEYYQLLAYFNNTADTDLDNEAPHVQVPLAEQDFGPAMELDRQIYALKLAEWESASKALSDEQTQWQPLRGFTAKTNNTTKVVTAEVGDFTEYQTEGTVAKQTTVVIESDVPAGLRQLTALRFTGLPEDLEAALIDSEWGFVVSHFKVELLTGDEATELRLVDVVADTPESILDPDLSLSSKNNNGFGAYSRIHYPRSAVFALENAVELPASARLRVSIKQDVIVLGAFPLVAHRGRLEVSGDTAFQDWFAAEETIAARTKLAELEKQRKAIASVAIPVMRERPDSIARPSRVFDRGNYLTKSAPVQPATPGFLPGIGDAEPNRLGLARWIASPENPLTSRVAVNRFWAQLFGIGLVRTQEDFGSSGDSPSHPELLDDLATRFATDMNWSVKQLLRELVLSATYRQSSVVSPEKLAIDPDNRWLSHGPRNRLSAEMIRDQALAVSGLLSEQQFGPPVHPPIPSGVWQPFQGGDKWATPGKDDPNRYRRTVYTYTKRTIQFPILASFDAPTREFCSPRRMPSNTPLQALMTLNDTTFVEAGDALASRMLEHSDKLPQQLQYGFLLTLCREPKPNELQQLVKLYERQVAELARSQTVVEGDETNGQSGRQAMTGVATVLLNLDEVLNK